MQSITTKSMHAHDIALDIQITQLHIQIRNNPGKFELRVHLAQLLMVAGQWQKSLQQLQTAAQIDSKAAAMAQTYRALIQAEIHREQTFSGQREPQFFSAPEPWSTLLAEALVARTHQQTSAADKFQQHAFNDAPASAFTLNDTIGLDWIADGDSRLGPICEAFINGTYYWIPFQQIQQLTIESPRDLRDLVWIPATITLADFSQHFGFLPSRYVFSYQHDNDQLSLASLTEWQPLDEHSWAGLGQKMLVTDQGEYSLLALRTLTKAASE